MRLLLQNLLLPALLVVYIQASAQVTITGKIIPGEKWSNKLYLGLLEDFEGGFRLLDSAVMDDEGVFRLEARIPDSGAIFRLLLPPAGGNANFLVEGYADNYIYLPLRNREQYRVEAHADSLFYSAVIEGPQQTGITALREFKRPFYRLVLASLQEMQENKEMRENKDSLTAINNRMMARWQEQIVRYRSNLKGFLLKEEDPSLVILGMYYKYLADFGRYDSAFTRQMLDKTNTGRYSIAHRLSSGLGKGGLVRTGRILPPAALQTPEGSTVHFPMLKNEKLVIDFWASWCKPCRLANKGFLSDWQQRLRKGNIELVSISVDQDRQAWLRAIKEDRVSWLQLLDPQQEGLAEQLQVYKFPTYLVVGRNLEIEFETNNELELREYLFGGTE